MTYFPASLTGDGTTTDFSVPFEYAERYHVIVRVAGTRTADVGSQYEHVWLNPTAIRITSVVGSNPVPSGIEIVLERETDIDTAPTVYRGSNVSTEALLNN